MIEHYRDQYFMEEALRMARTAYDAGEIPVGAVIVSQERIIARAWNQTEQLKDVTAHAEILAITAASSYFNSKYLIDCTLYVTLEPCVMCAGALYWSQLKRIVYAAADEKRGFTTITAPLLHPRTQITTGIGSEESRALLQKFFKGLRT